MYMYMYVYIYIYIYLSLYIYIYIDMYIDSDISSGLRALSPDSFDRNQRENLHHLSYTCFLQKW